MKPNEWNEGLNNVDPDLVEEYVAQKEACAQKKKRTKPYWFAAVAAVLVLAIGIGSIFGGNRPLLANQVAAAEYPKMAQKPNGDDYHNRYKAYDEAYKTWQKSQRQQYNQPDGYADSLTEFFYASMTQFLQGDGNPTYSPLNVYMAMAMLAETTGGNSRQQILDLFGVDTIEQLREQAGYVWNAHYSDDGETTLLLANSLWLDDEYIFNKQTAQLLADRYYASSFHGDLGTETMDKQLQSWLNNNTGDLLKEQTKDMGLDPETVFALASTVYFTAGWKGKFSEGNTRDAVFHTSNGNLTTPFMNKSIQCTYYWSDNFGAIALELTGENRMWLILPDEGYTTDDILTSDDYLRMTLDPIGWENKHGYKVNISLPKFDVDSQTDLIEGMKAMGVTDIFDYTISDFTPMTDTPMLYVNQINHAARVSIDEDGCIAASFTVISNAPGAAPPIELDEIDFVLDRPFLFIVSSRDNLPLFAGVVNEP